MWNPVEIGGYSWLFKCSIDDNSVRYYLSDLKQIWSEICSMDAVLTRVKEMNKRIEYDRETVLNTIKSHPESINIDNFEGAADSVTLVTVKYSVSRLPFNFKWKLNLCGQNEFLHSITHPLLLTLSCFSKQNKDLKEIIRKKDCEINQYKQEGAVLKRNKVATEPFDVEAFEIQYPKIKTDEFLKYADVNFDRIKADCSELIEITGCTGKSSSTTRYEGAANSNQLLKSPKGLKKAKIEKFQRKQKLLAQVGRVTYEDSDSCTPPNDNEEEIRGIKRSLEELKQKQHENGSQAESQVINRRARRKFNL